MIWKGIHFTLCATIFALGVIAASYGDWRVYPAAIAAALVWCFLVFDWIVIDFDDEEEEEE